MRVEGGKKRRKGRREEGKERRGGGKNGTRYRAIGRSKGEMEGAR